MDLHSAIERDRVALEYMRGAKAAIATHELPEGASPHFVTGYQSARRLILSGMQSYLSDNGLPEYSRGKDLGVLIRD
jgi:hypothetical protein